MECFKKLFAWRKVFAFGVDALVVVKIVLIAYESRCINVIVKALSKRRTNASSGSGWGIELSDGMVNFSSNQ